MYYYFLHQRFHRFLPSQHLSLSPVITTGSSEDLLSDALISLDVNCSPSRSCEASGLLPYLSFDDTSSDLELNTEDERRVTLPDSYENNNAPQSLDQIYHLTNATKLSDQDLYDDNNYDLAEDEVGLFGIFGLCPSTDSTMDSGIGCLPETTDDGWYSRDWSPDSSSYQEYDQDSLGNVSSSGAYSLSHPLKIPTLFTRSGSPGLFSDRRSGQTMCEYGGDDDFDIEYDFDVKP